jgi:hypothetical protein
MIATRGLGAGLGATLATAGLGAGYGDAPPEAPSGGSGPTFWMPEPLAWRMPDEEIIFLRRKTSSKAGV